MSDNTDTQMKPPEIVEELKRKLILKVTDWNERVTIIEIVYMDERFLDDDFIASNGWTITSDGAPTIDEDMEVISLWGSMKDLNTRPLIVSNENKSEVFKALNDWALNWDGWGKRPTGKRDYLRIF